MARPDWRGMRAQDFDTAVPLSLFDRPTGVGARDTIYGRPAQVRSTGPGDLFSLLTADTPRAASQDAARTAGS